jgi:PPOX class probable F420-dependent enzyme
MTSAPRRPATDDDRPPTTTAADEQQPLGRGCHDADVTSWRPGWAEFPQALLDFWTERHLCTLTTLRPDGSPHVVPVGVALDVDHRCAWVISSPGSVKVRDVRACPTVAACQVDGRHWSTLEGRGEVRDDEASVARAVERYAARYRQPRPNPDRVALRIEVDRFLVSASFAAG